MNNSESFFQIFSLITNESKVFETLRVSEAGIDQARNSQRDHPLNE